MAEYDGGSARAIERSGTRVASLEGFQAARIINQTARYGQRCR